MPSHVFHRNPRQDYPIAVAGEGAVLIDKEGRRYLDGSGGAAVSCLGHSDREVISAIHAQLDRLAFAHTSFFTNEPMEALADDLIAHAPRGLSQVYFVSGGSEAMEAALKMARQYFVEIGEPRRTRLIARRQSYHGNTLGALATGGNAWRRQPFAPLLIDVSHVSPCYAYRGMQAGESEPEFAQRLATELDTEIERLGPDRVMGFVAETVVGATLGAVAAVPGYFKAIRTVCDKHGVLLIADEVMCGMGRTGSLYACEQEGVSPDLITIGKGLGAGYQPIAATLASARVVDAIVRGSGFFQHGHTYIGHAVGCAAGLAVQRALRERGLIARVQRLGASLETKLRARLGDHPSVGDIRGRGLFWGVELVANRSTQKAFDPKLRLHAKIKAQALENGLMCYPMGGTVDGVQGDHVLIAPPFIITETELDELVDKLGRSIEQVLANVNNERIATAA